MSARERSCWQTTLQSAETMQPSLPVQWPMLFGNAPGHAQLTDPHAVVRQLVPLALNAKSAQLATPPPAPDWPPPPD
jgi:hypothetical protein